MLPKRAKSHRPTPPAAHQRRHLRLIDPADGAEILPDRRVYAREALTPWKVELEMDEPTHAEYGAAFHAVEDDEQACVAFSLTLPGTDLYPLQVRIWPNNTVEYESHVPLLFRIQPRKKTITVRMLATVRAVPHGIAVTYR